MVQTTTILLYGEVYTGVSEWLNWYEFTLTEAVNLGFTPKINNPGNGKNITQVQVSPGGGRHGDNPYVKISTNDQGIIKIIDGVKDTYKTDGSETSTIIFTGGK